MTRRRAALLAAFLPLLASCGPGTAPASPAGTWSGTHVVTVRVRGPQGPNRFVSDTALISLTIGADGHATGRVGGATLEDGWVLKNRGWFARRLGTGTDWRLEGRLQGPCFPADPVTTKDFQAPFAVAGDTLAGTLFQQSGMGVYPLVTVHLVRR